MKRLFRIFNSSRKQTKKLHLTSMVPQVEPIFFCFLEELKTPKRHFEINWPLAIEFRKWFFYLNLAKWRLILLKVKGPGPSVRHPLDSQKCDNFQLQFLLILGNFDFTVLFLPGKIIENIPFDVLANHIEKKNHSSEY